MRVLYSSHTGQVSGGEHSLLDLLAALPPEVSAEVACPQGELTRRLARAHDLPGTDASLRLHPVYTPRAIAGMVRAGWRLRAIADRTNADLVHANSIRAGLVALVARSLGGPPVVVHVRDRLPDGRAGALTLGLVARRAAAVVGNSEFTLHGVPRIGGAMREVIPSPVDLRRFDPSRVDRPAIRAALGVERDAPLLGVVGQLTCWKGQDDAIRALGRVRESHPDAQLLLVGSAKFVSQETRYDNPAYVRELHALCGQLGVADAVHFLGERDDVPELVGALDVLLVPSWAEPFGRVVIEGMAMGVPVVATNAGGPAEIIENGVDGVLLPPRRPEQWAGEVEGLLRTPERRLELAATARERVASTYAIDSHLERVLDLYRRLLDRRRNGAVVTSSAVGRAFL